MGNSKENKDLFESNYISTTKYNTFTFLPLSLMLQFKRYANIYFLFMAILQSTPLSPLNPFSSIAPLVFVISLSVIREGFEDISRHRSDLELNSSKSIKYTKGYWTEVDWKDIFVGDMVKVTKNQFFPADLICLSSSDPEGNCFIQTTSLDGEKNLKPRTSFPETQKMIGNGKVMRIAGTLEVGKPNSDLYDARGKVSIGGDAPLNVEVKQFLLRGSALKNTDWVIGVCAYTGKDSKIMKNAEDSKYKQSSVEKKTNTLIVYIFLIQLGISICIGFLNAYWTYRYSKSYRNFIPKDYVFFVQGIIASGSTFVLTNSMIPISLIISLEMVKMAQAYFISVDEEMHCLESDRYPKVFTSSLNEELGQIEFVFSDKTGTLTCNRMEFKICIIGDVVYGDTSMLNDNYKESKSEEEQVFFNDKRLESLNSSVGQEKKIKLDLPLFDQGNKPGL